MYLIRKKDVLQELAVCLFLTLQFKSGSTPEPVIKRARERADAALQAAQAYTGVIGDKELTDFLTIHPLRFSIDCGDDIVKGDTIRFTEQVMNNKLKPPRQIGVRGIIARVTGVIITEKGTLLHLRVISSGGVWEEKADADICRTLRIVTRMDVMRVAWDDEARRQAQKDNKGKIQPQIKTATAQLLKRGNNAKP